MLEEIQKLREIDCRHKNILMRVDTNVALDQLEDETEIFRLTLLKESINFILSFPGSTVTLIGHFGRPEGKVESAYSLLPLRSILENILNQSITFIPDCLQKPQLSKTRVTLLENVRFYQEEEKNDKDFAGKLARGYDFYVNEAFSVSHRSHASVDAITHFLPSYIGLHFEKEVLALQHALKEPQRPAVAVLGGNKIETKLRLIETFIQNYDTILLGGKLANEALERKMTFPKSVVLPIDFYDATQFDIGPQTIELFSHKIQEAGTILWNGTLGKYEEKPYDTGSKEVMRQVLATRSYKLAGGGDALTLIQSLGVFNQFDLISSGGGAMLSFLAGEKLPGLEALRKNITS